MSVSNILTDRYEILTDSGWANFHGIKRSSTNSMISILTSTGKKLDCTPDHKVATMHGFSEAKNIKASDTIKTSSGYEEVFYVTENTVDETYVYDALHVHKGHKYYTNDIVSHNCEFVGSSGTLISGSKLKELDEENPILESEGLRQFNRAEKDHIYAITVDVSRGKGLDYSTFSVFDVSGMPYTQVCIFRDNLISPVDFSSIIFRVAKMYNEASVLVEINDIGGQVSDTLLMDFGYENMLFTENAGRSGKRISAGFGSNAADSGIRTTKTVKAIGCSILKLLIEQNQLLIKDTYTINELKRFSRKGNSYEAEPGTHDDMVMNLVIFAWLTDQNYFKDMTDINTLSRLRERTEEQIGENLLPFGFIDDGREEPDVIYMPSNRW